MSSPKIVIPLTSCNESDCPLYTLASSSKSSSSEEEQSLYVLWQLGRSSVGGGVDCFHLLNILLNDLQLY